MNIVESKRQICFWKNLFIIVSVANFSYEAIATFSFLGDLIKIIIIATGYLATEEGMYEILPDLVSIVFVEKRIL